MKKSFLSFLSLLAAMLMQAQDVKITAGPEYIDESGTNIVDIIGDDGSGMIMLRAGKKKIFIEKYSYDMIKIYSTEVKIPSEDRTKYELERCLILNGKVYVFVSRYNKDADLNFLYGAIVTDNGDLANEPVELASISGKNQATSGDFDIIPSVDSSKVLIVKHQDVDKDEGEQIGLMVFNKDLSMLWQKDFGMDYQSRRYDLKNSVVDKNGNVHMIAKIYIPASQRPVGAPKYNYEIFSYFYQDEYLKLYNIDLGESYINDVDIRINNKDILVGAGFYSEKSTYLMKGAFYLTIDPVNREVQGVYREDFSKEFLMNFMSEKSAEKGKELSNYVIRGIHAKPEGGAVIIAEYYQMITTTTTTYRPGVRSPSGMYSAPTYTTTTRYEWLYNDVIVADINTSGKIEHYVWMPKKQRSNYSNSSSSPNASLGKSYVSPYVNNATLAYFSIASIFVKDKLYIIYNDNPKNSEISDPDKIKYMTSPQSSITTLATINEQGEISKISLFAARDKENHEMAIVKPRFHANISDNAMILLSESGKKYKFIKLTF